MKKETKPTTALEIFVFFLQIFIFVIKLIAFIAILPIAILGIPFGFAGGFSALKLWD